MNGFSIDYEATREHATRLRKIILHSADVLSRQVAGYLKTVAGGRNWKAKDQILKTFIPLVGHLPAEFVDFALHEMIDTDEEESWPSFDDMTRLGIARRLDYHPAAHVQGPFLHLLRTHEDEGLRLVHGLTNAATTYWCGRERNERFLDYSRTPLPVVFQTPTGPKELWGNEDVYRWFRHTSVAPEAVVSALMALEVWMEERIEGGRDGSDLIVKVMAGSRSVAVLGVCVSIALAFPARCLPGVLPFIAHPLVWRMDIHRRGQDLRGTPIIDFIGEHRHINERLQERNERPQRKLDVRTLVALALFEEDATVRKAFDAAFATFGDETPFQFEEQKGQPDVVQALGTELADYRGILNRENYRPVRTETAIIWQYHPPRKPTQEETERFENVQRFFDYTALAQWAEKAQRTEKLPDPDDLAKAARAARSCCRAEDFSTAIGHNIDLDELDRPSDAETDPIRERAIAAVAAVLASKGWSWADQEGYAAWCRSVLLAAAHCPRNRFDAANRESIYDLDHKLNAARGLTALVAQGAGDAEIRQTVLGLVLDPQLQVVQAIFAGLRPVWGRDDVLCLNCLAMALSLAVVPGDAVVPGMGLVFNEAGIDRMRGLWEQHAMNLERCNKPRMPVIEVDERGFFRWDIVGRAIRSLPVDQLARQPDAKAALLGLADSLLCWTISENRRGSDDDDRPRRHSEAPWEWNQFVMGWLANLARFLSLDDAERHVFAPVRATCEQLPSLTEWLLYGLVEYQIGFIEPPEPQAVRSWEGVCRDLLDRPQLAQWADEEYLPGDWSVIVELMVFVNHGRYVYEENWPHGPVFSGVISRWLDVVGTNHKAYRAFLTMLRAASRHFPPAQVVGWLHAVASRSSDLKALWRSDANGERTGRVLHAVWQASRQILTADQIAFRQFSELVDRLAANGVPLASVIQQNLEGRNAD